MKKSIRILSLAAAVLLIGLIAASLIFAFLGVEWSGAASLACLSAALVLSVLIYGIRLIVQKQKKSKDS
jgi:hypothetical protein